MYLMISAPKNSHFDIAIGNSEHCCVLPVNKAFVQSAQLLRTVDSALAQMGKKLKSLTGLIVVSGPGDFSALRIGVVVANTLAYSLNIPVVGVKIDTGKEREAEIGRLWQVGVKKLATAKIGKFVKPEYGAEPHIYGKQR